MTYDFDSLNDLQKKITQDTQGAILVTAGAGSGKTRLLTHRICYLIDNKKVNPYNILAITFTNKATREMRERLSLMVNSNSNVFVSTFHALCVNILRENIQNLEGFDKWFSIYDDSDKEKLLKKVINDLKLDMEDKNTYAFHIAAAKNLGYSPSEYALDIKNLYDVDDIINVYSEYQKQLNINNALDFDDLLIKCYELLSQFYSVRTYYQEKFHYIFVDEFQDTNLVQYKILKLLSGKYKNIFVVGDEDQCIYSWRGANIENINLFIKEYGAKIYKLEQNYRSTKNIINVANKLIKHNTSRIDKTLYTNNDIGEEVTYNSSTNEIEESEYVIRKIIQLHTLGVEYTQIGILMRVSALSRIIEEKLLNYNIPFQVSGIFKFFDRLEIKNLLAYLKMIVNPKDNASILRIINVPKRSIGESTIEKLIEISTNNQISIVKIIENLNDYDFSKAIKTKLENFKDIYLALKDNYENMSLTEFVEFVIKTTKFKDQYNSNSEEDINRKMNIDQFILSVKTFEENNEGATLLDYIESVTLINELEDSDTIASKVSVSTVHASKGLEFDYVFIIGVEDGRFPLIRCESDCDIEEERRLMYVASTRARKKLFITRAQSRFLYGDRKATVESRFVKEMDLSNNFRGVNYINNNLDNNFMQPKQKQDQTQSNVNNNLSNLMQAKLNLQKNKFDDYKIGVQVLHAKFGVGTIIKLENIGDNSYVSVDFSGIGVKTLSLNIAPLQILKK